MKKNNSFFLLLMIFMVNSCATQVSKVNHIDRCDLDMGNRNELYNIGLRNVYEENRTQIELYYQEPGSIRTLNIYDAKYRIKMQFFPLSFYWVCNFSLELNTSQKFEQPYIKINNISPNSDYFDIYLGDSIENVKRKLSRKHLIKTDSIENVITLNSNCTINNKYYSIPNADYQAEYFFEGDTLKKMQFKLLPL